jgi:hypothetical protein
VLTDKVLDAEPKDTTVIRLQRPGEFIFTIEQYQRRLHSIAIQLPDQGEKLRFRACAA